jgi:hypothetical protein
MLAAALRYAGAGIRVFPTNGKAPLTEHGFHDASSERERVEAWWSFTSRSARRPGSESGP